MKVKTSDLDSVSTELNQHWQWAFDKGNCAVVIGTTQKALPANAAVHHMKNTTPSFSFRL